MRGAGDVWRGFGFLLRQPSLWPWALLPMILNVILFVGLTWLGWHFFSDWVGAYLLQHEGWLWTALGWLLKILFWILTLLLVIFLFVPLGALIAAPFNDILSEKVERLYGGGSVDEGFSLRALARGVAVATATSLRLAMITIGLIACTLPLYLFPPIGPPLAGAISTAITIRFIALEFTSYSMDRRYYNYAQRRDFLRRNRARTLGLGAMAFCLMLIPLVNALFIPVSAVAGTLIFCDTEMK